MARISFAREGVKKLYDYIKGQGGNTFALAKDQGLYLCGNPVKHEDGSYTNEVVYASGCNPDTDDDWYERARDLVGGDDFGENLPLQWLDVFLNHPHYASRQVMALNVGKTQISLGK